MLLILSICDELSYSVIMPPAKFKFYPLIIYTYQMNLRGKVICSFEFYILLQSNLAACYEF